MSATDHRAPSPRIQAAAPARINPRGRLHDPLIPPILRS
jgi:hypothetical protein